MEILDCVIVGAGPAGMSAALYTSRGNLKTLIIEKECPGGKMLKTNIIENYMYMSSQTYYNWFNKNSNLDNYETTINGIFAEYLKVIFRYSKTCEIIVINPNRCKSTIQYIHS